MVSLSVIMCIMNLFILLYINDLEKYKKKNTMLYSFVNDPVNSATKLNHDFFKSN